MKDGEFRQIKCSSQEAPRPLIKITFLGWPLSSVTQQVISVGNPSLCAQGSPIKVPSSFADMQQGHPPGPNSCIHASTRPPTCLNIILSNYKRMDMKGEHYLYILIFLIFLQWPETCANTISRSAYEFNSFMIYFLTACTNISSLFWCKGISQCPPEPCVTYESYTFLGSWGDRVLPLLEERLYLWLTTLRCYRKQH